MGLMRRMPPKHSETALSALLSLLPDHSSDLLSQVDQPLQVFVLSLGFPNSQIDLFLLVLVNILNGFLLLLQNNDYFFGGKKQVLFDEESGKEFILCEYNRDADSYRY